MTPDAPEEVREAARFAFWEVQMPRDDARAVALARERIRNAGPAQVAHLKSEFGGGLWEARMMYEPDFASLPFKEQKQRFKADLPVAVVSWGTVEVRPGQRGHAPFHAAGVLLLSWWQAQGHRVTANPGRGHAKPGAREPKPCATIRFLAHEFLDIARWYANSEWAESDSYDSPQARELGRLSLGNMQQIACKVAQRHKMQSHGKSESL